MNSKKTNSGYGIKDIDDDVEQALQQDASSATPTPPPPLTAEERRIQKLLAEGAYHLPNNQAWYQDFLQYICNNHPIFSVCFQSPLHPISKGMRAVGLLGSVMVGLVLTNIIYMWQLSTEDETEEPEEAIFQLSAGGFAVYNGTSVTYINDDNVVAKYTQFEISSTAMLVLWTVGSAAHSLFDSFLWYASSCQCCNDKDDDDDNNNQPQQPSKWRKYCNILIVIMVIVISTAATLAVVIRAMIEDSDSGQDSANAILGTMDKNNNNNNNTELSQLMNKDAATPLTNKKNYDFLQDYAIELVLAWFVWFFIIEGILFSGILSCGGRFFPNMLGGWPYEMKQEQKKKNSMDKTHPQPINVIRNSKNIAVESKKKNKRQGAQKKESVNDDSYINTKKMKKNKKTTKAPSTGTKSGKKKSITNNKGLKVKSLD
ncbi:hypothetical protein IV203_027201 [Nitzschia inconspicua]|uniref:Transmembrane protein n=1 Tax=Nitzschia inconspicua TaxID=303405 RepID=A0A9K3LVT2_9STRA|nr:hypothetical protein IV203_027201 [Nitzschia inconspicua]